MGVSLSPPTSHVEDKMVGLLFVDYAESFGGTNQLENLKIPTFFLEKCMCLHRDKICLYFLEGQGPPEAHSQPQDDSLSFKGSWATLLVIGLLALKPSLYPSSVDCELHSPGSLTLPSREVCSIQQECRQKSAGWGQARNQDIFPSLHLVASPDREHFRHYIYHLWVSCPPQSPFLCGPAWSSRPSTVPASARCCWILSSRKPAPPFPIEP